MKKIFRTTVLVSLFFICSGTFAQEKKFEWKEGNEGGYRYAYVNNDPTNARFYTLKNGLTVILSPSKKKPRIQTYIATKAGSKTDPQEHTGLAHYLEHMLFKGTDKFGSLDWEKEKPLLDQIDALYEQYNATSDEVERKAIYKEIDRVSGEAAKFAIPNEYDKLMSNMGAEGTNAFTSFEQTVYTEDIPNNVVDKYLTVQAERFRNPTLRLFHTELESVYEEKNIGLDNDSRQAVETMFEAIFPNNNYGKQTVIGTIEHLKNPSLKAIREYYNTYYVPNNMGIIMSGDFDPSEVIAKIDKAFSYMQPKDIPAYHIDPEKPIEAPIVREVKGPNAEFIFLGFRFPGATSDDAQLLNLMGRILTNGSAGLIDLNLVKSQKLLSAAAYPYVLKDYSLLILEGNATQGQSLDDVRSLLLGQLQKLRNGEFSDDLISSIINNEKKALILQNESYKDRAEQLMTTFITGVDWAKEIGYVDRLSTITKQDIVDFANKYLNDQNYVAVYKKQGVDNSIVKVEKPTITPITMNRSDQSAFLQTVNALPEESIEPVWLDYEKDIARGKLDDLDVLAVQNKDNAIFSLTYQFPIGRWNNKLLPLAAGYIRQLGTKDKSSEQFSKEFFNLASNFSVSAGNEETYISTSGLDENFNKIVLLLHDLLRNAAADEPALEAYIARVKKSRTDMKDNKGAILQGLISYARYGANNPFNYVLSDEELDAVKAADLVQILHDFANIKHTILYYGPREVKQLVTTLPTLKLSKGAYKSVDTSVAFKELPTDKKQVLFSHYDMKQAQVFWVRNSGAYDSAKEPIISLFNSYFGDGMGSIVFQTIRESKALAYSTYAFLAKPGKKENQYSANAFIGTQTDKFNEAIAGMNSLLDTLPESPVALETAKVSLMKSIASERITDADILNSYLSAKKLGLDTDIRKSVYEKAPKLDYADLKAFHEKEWSQKPYVYCIVGDREALTQERLTEIGETKTLSLKEIFGY